MNRTEELVQLVKDLMYEAKGFFYQQSFNHWDVSIFTIIMAVAVYLMMYTWFTTGKQFFSSLRHWLTLMWELVAGPCTGAFIETLRLFVWLVIVTAITFLCGWLLYNLRYNHFTSPTQVVYTLFNQARVYFNV